jgi:hypothetical protein
MIRRVINMKVLGLDPGFGDCKIGLMVDGVIKEHIKEVNAIAKLPDDSNSGIKYTGKEKNVIKYDNAWWLVGSGATEMPDSTVFNIDSFEALQKISPLLVKKGFQRYSEDPEGGADIDLLVVTISMAYLDKAEDYKRFLSDNIPFSKDKIRVIPQGAGCKIALDNIGLNINDPSRKKTIPSYLGLDIGFSTIDVFPVINGSIMGGGIKGYPGLGITKVAQYVQSEIKNNYKIDIGLTRVKEAMYEGRLSQRGNIYELKKFIDEGITKYISALHDFLEENYGDQLSSMSNVVIFGGGAEVLKTKKEIWDALYSKDFVLMPETESEFYNCLGALFFRG